MNSTDWFDVLQLSFLTNALRPVGTSKLDPESLGHDPTSLDSFLYRQGNWIAVVSPSPSLHLRYSTRWKGVQRALPQRECQRPGGTHPSLSSRPLQSTTEPPVPIRSRVCKLTEKKRTSCIKIQGYFIQLQYSEPLQMYNLYTVLFFKVRCLSLHSHHTCLCVQVWDISLSGSTPPHTTRALPCRRGTGGGAVCSTLSIKITQYSLFPSYLVF